MACVDWVSVSERLARRARSPGWAPTGDMAALAESIHRVDLGEAAWLRAVAMAVEALLPGAGMVVAPRIAWNHGRGDYTVPRVGSSSTPDATYGQSTAHPAESHFLKELFGAGRPVFTLRALFGASLDGLHISHVLGDRGLRDLLCVQYLEHGEEFTSRAGFYVGSATTEGLSASAERSWLRIAAHLGAAARLRFDSTGSPVEGILSPDGRLLDARGPASTPTSRDALRRAALAIERARLRDRRTDIDGVLDAWRAVYERRWTLVESVESDGRRLLLARVNVPQERTVPGGTERQQQIAALLAQGFPQKAIAFELQIAPSTVAFHVRRLAATLGLSTVPEMVVRLRERSAAS